MSFTSQETEVLLGFIDWQIRDCRKHMAKVEQWIRAEGKPHRMPKRLRDELEFWERLKEKFT